MLLLLVAHDQAILTTIVLLQAALGNLHRLVKVQGQLVLQRVRAQVAAAQIRHQGQVLVVRAQVAAVQTLHQGQVHAAIVLVVHAQVLAVRVLLGALLQTLRAVRVQVHHVVHGRVPLAAARAQVLVVVGAHVRVLRAAVGAVVQVLPVVAVALVVVRVAALVLLAAQATAQVAAVQVAAVA